MEFTEKEKELLDARISHVAERLSVEKAKVLEHFPHFYQKFDLAVPPKGRDVAQWIDHTNLNAFMQTKDLEKLVQEAKKYQFKAVCVNSAWVKPCKDLLGDEKIGLASVVGFPLGAMETKAKAFEAERAVEGGATEIDMVINVGRLLEGDYKYVLEDIKAVVEASKEAVTKVIIETCYLTTDTIVDASILAIMGGAHFIKTSTGFGKEIVKGSGTGAKAEHVRLMKLVAGPEHEVKASGGVRTFEAAMEMIKNGATRIGASSSVKIVEQAKE